MKTKLDLKKKKLLTVLGFVLGLGLLGYIGYWGYALYDGVTPSYAGNGCPNGFKSTQITARCNCGGYWKKGKVSGCMKKEKVEESEKCTSKGVVNQTKLDTLNKEKKNLQSQITYLQKKISNLSKIQDAEGNTKYAATIREYQKQIGTKRKSITKINDKIKALEATMKKVKCEDISNNTKVERYAQKGGCEKICKEKKTGSRKK